MYRRTWHAHNQRWRLRLAHTWKPTWAAVSSRLWRISRKQSYYHGFSSFTSSFCSVSTCFDGASRRHGVRRCSTHRVQPCVCVYVLFPLSCGQLGGFLCVYSAPAPFLSRNFSFTLFELVLSSADWWCVFQSCPDPALCTPSAFRSKSTVESFLIHKRWHIHRFFDFSAHFVFFNLLWLSSPTLLLSQINMWPCPLPVNKKDSFVLVGGFESGHLAISV